VAHKYDAFELVWPNDSVLVLIKVAECLTQPLALQALHELREFIVCVACQHASIKDRMENAYSQGRELRSSSPSGA